MVSLSSSRVALFLTLACVGVLLAPSVVVGFTPTLHKREAQAHAARANGQLGVPGPGTDCQDEHSSTVWMCISTVLVLGMSPALALFEAGMLRSKSTVSLITQIFAGVITLSVMWVCFGYSLTFGTSQAGLIGNLDHAFYIDVSYSDCSKHAQQIPEALFATFQMMFAVITPLLMTGSFAERMKFKSYLIFIVLWQIIVYYPLAHSIWGGGLMGRWGVLDFAGGIVIHTSAGMGSLVSALYMGRRKHFYDFMGEFPPSNLPLAATGAALLWIGWFGFNGGSALASGPGAVSAIVSTQVGCSCGAFTWLVLSWWREKPQAVALMNGALAGLAGITPASGYINTPASILMGFIFGISSYYSVVLMKHHLHIDDALDVSSVHGLTGVLGALAIGLFAQQRIDPDAANGAFYGHPAQLGYQVVGILVTMVWAGLWTYILLFLLDYFQGGLRAPEDEEEVGLDWAEHHEIAYHKLHVLDDASIADEPLYHPPEHTTNGTTSHPNGVSSSLLSSSFTPSDIVDSVPLNNNSSSRVPSSLLYGTVTNSNTNSPSPTLGQATTGFLGGSFRSGSPSFRSASPSQKQMAPVPSSKNYKRAAQH